MHDSEHVFEFDVAIMSFLVHNQHCYFSVMIVHCFATCKSANIFVMRVYYDSS